ncbi:DUF5304 family protein [Streptomyces triticirhizae]|uniref:DUF5304 domain-containing protein n=1 Tax=Streptomyces triticirhizae TaxID=2483353 RepID=A0A3M2LQ89_9ACTN|nr:DUF5304 family protein [Streptomyces triticirhizae]RMI37018.1 hypothetical protein EBN88_20105 [Streptomyces triticirhizae]
MGDASEPQENEPAPAHEATPGAAGPADDADPWAAACAEDLAAERERRRAAFGPERPDPTEELRRLADALTGRLGELGSRLPQVGLLAKPLASQARAAIDPMIERNADAIQHLASAGQELLAAYRSAVLGQEGRWSRPDGAEGTDAARGSEGGRERDGADDGARDAGSSGNRGPDQGSEGASGDASADDAGQRRGNRDEGDDSVGPGGAHRIDLD